MNGTKKITWLTDSDFQQFAEENQKFYAILFDSHYNTGTAKMIETFRFALENVDQNITAGVCIIEDAPSFRSHFNIRGIPTVIAGVGESIIGESLGIKTSQEMTDLLRNWIAEANTNSSRTTTTVKNWDDVELVPLTQLIQTEEKIKHKDT